VSDCLFTMKSIQPHVECIHAPKESRCIESTAKIRDKRNWALATKATTGLGHRAGYNDEGSPCRMVTHRRAVLSLSFIQFSVNVLGDLYPSITLNPVEHMLKKLCAPIC
jgi:hypothetical protein